MAAPDKRAYASAAFGSQVAYLDATAAIDRDGTGIGRVVRLRPQFNRLAGATHRQFKAAGRTALVRIVGADDGKGEGGEGQWLVSKMIEAPQAET